MNTYIVKGRREDTPIINNEEILKKFSPVTVRESQIMEKKKSYTEKYDKIKLNKIPSATLKNFQENKILGVFKTKGFSFLTYITRLKWTIRTYFILVLISEMLSIGSVLLIHTTHSATVIIMYSCIALQIVNIIICFLCSNFVIIIQILAANSILLSILVSCSTFLNSSFQEKLLIGFVIGGSLFGVHASPITQLYIKVIIGALLTIGIIIGDLVGKQFSNISSWVVSSVYIVLSEVIFVIQSIWIHQTHRRSFKQKNSIEAKIGKLASQITENEKLLQNILPKPIAERVIEDPKSLYKRDSISNATICVIKVVGISADVIESLKLLDVLYSAFDNELQRFKASKIKSFRSTYVCCCGCPKPVWNHHSMTACLALNLQEIAQKILEEKKIFSGIKIGIHSCGFVAGVLGRTKFSYEILSDQGMKKNETNGVIVNVAFKLCYASQVGKILVGKSTAEVLRKHDRFELTPSSPDENAFYLTKSTLYQNVD